VDRAIPADLETITLKALAKEPAERYATAKELADDLRNWLEDRPIQARRPTLSERASKWARRHRPFVRAAVGLVVLGLVLLTISNAVVWYSRQQLAEEVRLRNLHDSELAEALERTKEREVQFREGYESS